MRTTLICSIQDCMPTRPVPAQSHEQLIDELNAQIEAAQAAGNTGEAEELYWELEQLTANY